MSQNWEADGIATLNCADGVSWRSQSAHRAGLLVDMTETFLLLAVLQQAGSSDNQETIDTWQGILC